MIQPEPIRWLLSAAKPFCAHLSAALLGIGVTAACSSAPPAPPVMPDITYSHKAPLSVAAADIMLVESFSSPRQEPHIEHLVKQPPAAIVRRWVAQRLQADGTEGQLRVNIEDASLVQEQLPVKTGLADIFYDEQSARITGRLTVRVDYSGPRGLVSHFAIADVAASRTVPEGATLNERDRAVFGVVESLAISFDETMVEEMETHMPEAISR